MTGGRGSGKTFVVMDYEARCLLQKNDRCLYTRYTMTSAEKSIIPEFKQRLEDIGISQICNTTMDTVTNLMNGSFVFFSGLKPSSNTQKANLKSLPDINRWIIEEGEDFDDFERFNKIDDSIRTTKAHNEVLWLQNPSTAEHFIYKTYFEKSYKTVKIDGFDVQICTHPDVEHIHTTFLDNIDNLDKSFLQKAYEWREKAKKGDPQAIRFYTNNYLGAWVDRPEGVVFTDWEEGEFDESLQFIFGQDFGFEDPTTLIKVAVDEKNKIIYADELVYQSHLNPDQLLAYNKNYAKCGLIVGDSNRIDTIYDLRRKGVNIMPTTKFHGSIESGIYRMLGYKLIVTPTSYNLKKELRNYVYLDKGAKVFVDKWNHCFVGTTMICTDHGLKQIKNIKVGDMVSTSKGFRKVVNVFDNGCKKVCAVS